MQALNLVSWWQQTESHCTPSFVRYVLLVCSREHWADKRIPRATYSTLIDFPVAWDVCHDQCGARSGSPQLLLDIICNKTVVLKIH